MQIWGRKPERLDHFFEGVCDEEVVQGGAGLVVTKIQEAERMTMVGWMGECKKKKNIRSGTARLQKAEFSRGRGYHLGDGRLSWSFILCRFTGWWDTCVVVIRGNSGGHAQPQTQTDRDRRDTNSPS